MGDQKLEAGFAEIRGEARAWDDEVCKIQGIQNLLGDVDQVMRQPLLDGMDDFAAEYTKVLQRFKELTSSAVPSFQSVSGALNSTVGELEQLDHSLGDGMSAVW